MSILIYIKVLIGNIFDIYYIGISVMIDKYRLG